MARRVAELSPRSAAASAVPAIPSRGRQPLWASLRPGGDVGPQPATADPPHLLPTLQPKRLFSQARDVPIRSVPSGNCVRLSLGTPVTGKTGE